LRLTKNSNGLGDSLPTQNFKKDRDDIKIALTVSEIAKGTKPKPAKVNNGCINALLPAHGKTEDDLHTAMSNIEANCTNFSKISYIGLARENAANLKVLYEMVTKDIPLETIEKCINYERAKKINGTPSNVIQVQRDFFKHLLLHGVYDSFVDVKTDLKNVVVSPFFFFEVAFIWPFVCGSAEAKRHYKEKRFKKLFKGSAETSFVNFMHELGFDETSYPFQTSGKEYNKYGLLKVWTGADFSDLGGKKSVIQTNNGGVVVGFEAKTGGTKT
jgi:hypothetical protein